MELFSIRIQRTFQLVSTDYKKYKCPDVCAELLEKGHYHYFGPSRASLSIVYIFN